MAEAAPARQREALCRPVDLPYDECSETTKFVPEEPPCRFITCSIS